MLIFVVKSAICLTVLYGFYWFFLRNAKSLVFNRYYLLFSLLFAFSIPLVSFSSVNGFLLSINIGNLFNSNATPTATYGNGGEQVLFSILQRSLLILYLTVSFFLLARYISNLLRITGNISKGPRIDYSDAQLVLVDDIVLPYSFLKYIFINKTDFESGKIEDKLLAHEKVHCLQYHSVDIMIAELFKVFFWFNPFVWSFSRAIQLNHEYLADNTVLSRYELNDYKNTLLNIVFRNNTIYLASHFNYSSIKKRLIMMEKKKSDSMVLRILVTIPLFLFLGLVFANAQDSLSTKKGLVKQTDTLKSPAMDTGKMKVMQKDGKLYVVTPDGKLIEVDKSMVPPPPPPPPPPPKKEK